MIVERRCPTCISFAIFGEEKSTNTLRLRPIGGFGPCCTTDLMAFVRVSVDRWMLMKPLGCKIIIMKYRSWDQGENISIYHWIQKINWSCTTTKDVRTAATAEATKGLFGMQLIILFATSFGVIGPINKTHESISAK